MGSDRPQSTDPTLITDEINDPKRFILNLTTESKNSSLRNGMIFSQKNTLKPGPDYNGCLITFVKPHSWLLSKLTIETSKPYLRVWLI
ncbi:MAG: hypothetical protein OMM_12669 [Candidatus Magnetoglobus multicellularis str. Araruama]|uniref:Uncharacterized protein n=1 Tax=Candidatus Magnetoglobus multicellularis str. Araruama TaxID=890399 RepID=A0A1V1NVA6_9BACT|nr:MAG: hypothetical protein OMM_12669 [Candidatus Magnetoglobus multicellularis str. Araruama]